MPLKNMLHLSLGVLVLLTSSLACGGGQPTADPPAARQPAAASPAAKPPAANSATVESPAAKSSAANPSAAAGKRIAARNVVDLRQEVGRRVTVYGRIGRTAKSRSGLHFLNFADSELTAVCFRDDVKNFSKGGPATLYANKDVEVSGLLELYRGKLQIRVRGPDQVRIVERPREKPTAGVTLKKTGKDAWISPAGLQYRGRDPAGLTRVEHIGRHTRDIPNRDGPHGVFDGGQSVALAVIDEAWKLARQRKLRPNRERDRSSFTIRMNRRIGYLGGRSGAARNNPPLERVFIVFETGTKNIITAFPK